MQSVSREAVPVQALKALESWLWDQHYSQHCVERIVAHAAAEGTPTGCPELDPEDEATATEVYVEAMPAVPSVSWQWDFGDMSGRWTDAAAVATRAVQHYAYEPGDDDRSIPAGAVLVPPELEPGAPFEPTAEDIAFLASIESLPPISGGAPDVADEMRDWYDRHPLAEFNAGRPDGDE